LALAKEEKYTSKDISVLHSNMKLMNYCMLCILLYKHLISKYSNNIFLGNNP